MANNNVIKKSGGVLKKIITSDVFILTIVFINAVIVFLEETLPGLPFLHTADFVCTIIFIIEMLVKQRVMGFKEYWKSSWECFDGILVLISLPSIVEFFYPIAGYNLSLVLLLRLFRVVRIFRVTRVFRGEFVLKAMLTNFKIALRDSAPVFLFYIVIVFIFGVMNCSIFKEVSPQYFATPLESIYSVFRLFTIEGWYEIPDSLAKTMAPWAGYLVRFYFVLLLVGGGIIGMSLINSIFVDAMVSDNNDVLEKKIDELEKKIDLLLENKNMELKSDSDEVKSEKDDE